MGFVALEIFGHALAPASDQTHIKPTSNAHQTQVARTRMWVSCVFLLCLMCNPFGTFPVHAAARPHIIAIRILVFTKCSLSAIFV
jgi:hypothetical protein